MSIKDSKIAIVGVGRMGANMARRLKDVGATVSAVFDNRREVAEELAGELGCAAPDSQRVLVGGEVQIGVNDEKVSRSVGAISGARHRHGAQDRAQSPAR